jgi:hypothetical protein
MRRATYWHMFFLEIPPRTVINESPFRKGGCGNLTQPVRQQQVAKNPAEVPLALRLLPREPDVCSQAF